MHLTAGKVFHWQGKDLLILWYDNRDLLVEDVNETHRTVISMQTFDSAYASGEVSFLAASLVTRPSMSDIDRLQFLTEEEYQRVKYRLAYAIPFGYDGIPVTHTVSAIEDIAKRHGHTDMPGKSTARGWGTLLKAANGDPMVLVGTRRRKKKR